MFAIRVEPARLQQRDAILHFLLDHFRLEEPLCHALHLTSIDAQKFFGDMVDRGLLKSVSFVALNDQNDIVGCRMNELITLPIVKKPPCDDEHPQNPSCPSRRCHWPPAVKKLSDFLDYLTRDIDKLLPAGTNSIMKFAAVSVHPDYQRRGIATRLIDASMSLAKERGCEYVFTGATAYRSQQLFETKLGFQTLRIVEHKDYLDPDTGVPMFKCDDGTTCAKLLVKKL